MNNRQLTGNVCWEQCPSSNTAFCMTLLPRYRTLLFVRPARRAKATDDLWIGGHSEYLFTRCLQGAWIYWYCSSPSVWVRSVSIACLLKRSVRGGWYEVMSILWCTAPVCDFFLGYISIVDALHTYLIFAKYWNFVYSCGFSPSITWGGKKLDGNTERKCRIAVPNGNNGWKHCSWS